MSFEWEKRWDCLAKPGPNGPDVGRCDADRAEMIAEGERLQAEKAKLRAAFVEMEAQFIEENERLRKDIDKRVIDFIRTQDALNTARDNEARLRDALQFLAETTDGWCSQVCGILGKPFCRVHAALSGQPQTAEGKHKLGTNSGVKP
jgi:hypothetical protein